MKVGCAPLHGDGWRHYGRQREAFPVTKNTAETVTSSSQANRVFKVINTCLPGTRLLALLTAVKTHKKHASPSQFFFLLSPVSRWRSPEHRKIRKVCSRQAGAPLYCSPHFPWQVHFLYHTRAGCGKFKFLFPPPWSIRLNTIWEKKNLEQNKTESGVIKQWNGYT